MRKLLVGLVSSLSMLLLVTLASQTQAAPIIFSDQASFLTAAGPLTVEDFEAEAEFATPETAPPQASIAFDFFTASSSPDALKLLDETVFGNHNTTPEGSIFLSADTDLSFVDATVTLVFSTPIIEFGLFMIDIDIGDGSVEINGIGYSIAATGNLGSQYFGIIEDTPFTSVILNGGFENSHWSMDDLAFSVIPEPSTFLLTSLGLIGFALANRRRRSSKQSF